MCGCLCVYDCVRVWSDIYTLSGKVCSYFNFVCMYVCPFVCGSVGINVKALSGDKQIIEYREIFALEI